MTQRPTRAPASLRRVIAACLPAEDETWVSNDLEALYGARLAKRGKVSADLWYARQTAQFILRVGVARLAQFLVGGDGLRADVRHSARALLRRPAFAFAFIATLAIGVGVLSTVYAAARWVVLRPVPGVGAPDALFVMRLTLPQAPPHVAFDVSDADVRTFRERLPLAGGLAGVSSIDVDLSLHGGESRRVHGEMVSANYFQVLRAPMLAGRSFAPSEDREVVGGPAAIVSARLVRVLGAEPATVVGTSLRVNGAAVRVIGVTPEDFRGSELPGHALIWMPLSAQRVIDPSADANAYGVRSTGVWRKLIGRLPDGASLDGVQREVGVLVANMRKEFQATSFMMPAMEFGVSPGIGLDPAVRTSVIRTLGLVGGAAGMLLLLAIANLANLTLVRSLDVSSATAIRIALGATRLRIARAVMVDAVLLGLAGSIGAVIVATGWSRWYQSTQLSEHGGALAGMHVDGRGIAMAFGVAVVASMLAFLKALSDTGRVGLEPRLRRGKAGGHGHRMRATLVATQVALTVVLLVGSGLLARTVANLRNIDLGFDSDRILTFAMEPHLHGFESERLTAFARTAEERLAAVPGAGAAGLISPSPLRSSYFTASVDRPTATGVPAAPDQQVRVAVYFVSPGFLQAVGARVIGGERRWRGEAQSMVITQSAAAQLFPQDGPRLAAGRIVTARSRKKAATRIAAVIADIHLSDIKSDAPPAIFLPLAERYPGMSVTAFVSASRSPERMARDAQLALVSAFPEVPMYDVRSARAAVDQQFAERNAMARAASTLGLIGLLLAASGLYGVLANVIAVRRREFGIRSAMGAEPGRILANVVGGGLMPVLVGLGAGLAGSIAVSRALESQLYALDRFDLPSYAVAIAVLLAATLLACAVPAYRASRVSPAEVLRED